MATRAISHTPHQVVIQSPRTDTPPHFCKDCDVMFESSTSLKVHLSYHKENLLSRWTTPDVNNSTIMESSNNKNTNTNNSQPPPPISPADNNGNGPPTSTHPTYFHPDHGLGLYLTPQYNNNTGDRSGDPQQVNYRPIPNFEHHPHPYGSANGIPTTMPSNNVQYSSNTQQQQQQQQQLFSPNNPNGGDPPRPGSTTSSVIVKQERSEETPAEILDLDSHKVHVYQLPQQQQGLDSLGARNNFYRPYLPHILPPPPGNPNNGWPHPHDQFSPNFQPDHHPNMGIPHPHPYGHGLPAPPSQPGGNIVYELVREDGHRGGGVGYPPSEQPPMGYSPQLGPLPPSFRGQFPPNIPPQETGGSLMTGNPAVRATPPPQKKSPPTPSGGTGTGKKNANSASAANANGAPPKTKGWKGGECKRPKTYNCTACNKWFTSSGHLKRHYGTTLHKNSLKQKGENPDDPQHQQPTGRKAQGSKKSPGDKMTKGGLDSNHSHSMEGITGDRNNLPSPSRISIKHEDSTSSGKSTPPNFNNNNNNNGRGGEFHDGDDAHAHAPPSNIPNYVNVTNPYLPYNCVQPGPPLHSQYVLQNHFPSPGHGSPFPNGFIPDSGGGPPIGGIYSAVPASIVPTSIYNGGYSVITTANCETSLPPFSSVGFSHYDPNSFAHMTTAPLPQQGNPFPPPPQQQQQQQPQSGSPSPQGQGQGQQQQRMTPNGQHYQQGGPGPLSSPRPNSSGLLEAFGSDIRNNSSNSLNRNSPEAVRSASTASGSMEGSMDGMSGAGSPVQSLSDLSSGPDSFKGDILDSDSPTSSAPPVLLKCPECSKTFGRSCYLTQHTNSSHSGGKPFKCSTCGKRFPEEPALSDHFAKHGSDKPYKCTLCPKQFNHKTDLRRHSCLHTGKKPFECNVCGKGFIRKDHMAKHTETHRKQQNSNKIKHTNNVLSYIDNV